MIKKAIIISLLILLGILGSLAWRIWDYPNQVNVMSQAEYGIVLGATANGEIPTPVFRKRIEAGVKAYRQGQIQKLIFTGAPGQPSQAQIGKNLALSLQIPAEDILIEEESTNTLENLKFAQKAIPPGSTVLIISDPLHLMRASLFANRLELKASPLPVQDSGFQSLPAKMKFLFRETIAYAYYRLLDGLGLLKIK